MTAYVYSVAQDMPGGAVNLTKLVAEIRASSIVTALDQDATRVDGDDLTIAFKATLSNEDYLTLDGGHGKTHGDHPGGGLLAAHDNTPSEPEPSQVEVANIPEVVSVKPSNANRAYYFSVDLCKRETWYNQGTKVTDEAVGTGDGVTTEFYFDHGNHAVTGEAIIDLCHFKVTDEHLLVPAGGVAGGYVPVVKLDGTAKTEREAFESSGGDYEIDYTEGKLTFYTAPGNGVAITATYFYVAADKGPKIAFSPPTGKKWTIDYAEAQFSKDVVLTDTILQNVYVVPYEIPVTYETRLGNVGNIFDYTFGSFPVIPAFGGATRGATQDSIILRWDYAASIILRAQDHVELRCWTKHGRGFTGERAVISFYAIEEDDDA